MIGELGSRTVDPRDLASRRWLIQFVMASRELLKELEGYDELRERFVKSPEFHQMVMESEIGRSVAEALLRQLHHRFGEVPEAVEQRVRGADIERIVRWTDCVLSASSLADVFTEAS